MGKRLPPLTWLRAFEVSARHLSFTQAAQELHLTQTAVSKQVRMLEHYFGEALFLRKARSLALTETGAAYLPKLKENFARLAAATDEVFGDQKGNVLRLRCASSFAVSWLAPRLKDYCANNPGLQLRLSTSVWSEEFDRERLDFDIQYGSGQWSGLSADPLTQDQLFPVCAPSTSLSEAGDLVNERLLHVLGYEDGWGEWLAAAGVPEIETPTSMQFDNSLMAYACASQGQGIALGRSSLAATMLAQGTLFEPFSVRVPARENFYLIGAATGRRKPQAERFRSWLLDQASDDSKIF